jgi:hypothetical protein
MKYGRKAILWRQLLAVVISVAVYAGLMWRLDAVAVEPLTPIVQGIVSGLGLASFTVASMLPIDFPDKKTVLAAVFINRFAIGLLIPLLKISQPTSPGWLVGAAVGLLLSLPDAIVRRSYATSLIAGLLGGALVCLVP